ncbi:SagB family peptide dehydrogenase [Gordonia neofelifaecis]|uniref:SagB-type dehydrogenase domain-containing protein n=1 Tax=Gordonia neofelifaecis NRRL B-59395 TaxID=644548 RepID=F1YNM7_9ACTN|nr:SagB family peptide dehydrogenase [Gordonia neofelifaecis]EGD53637.1 SagB-type dehydrogenase domain-containing protein [Gordonia neofelifaecis NRRL B-59395]
MTGSSAADLRTGYAWRPGSKAVLGAPGTATVLPAKQQLTGLAPIQGGLLKALNAGPVAFDATPPPPVADLLRRLLSAGAVELTVSRGETPLYSLRPFRATDSARPEPANARAVLSRFTVLRRVSEEFVAEHPRSWCDVVVHDAGVAGLLSGAPGTVDAVVADSFWSDLTWTGHAVPDAGVEESEFGAASWSPHELWFHRRSTVGDRGTSWAHFGPTRWAEGRFAPVPAAPEPYDGAVVELPAPDLERLATTDVPLTRATESRVSTRSFDDAAPMTIEELGELLYRCARTRGVRTIEKPGTAVTELPSRPYPSGGSIYELEVYPVVRNVAGVESGMYHYDSVAHTLQRVADIDAPAVQRLLSPAALTLSDGELPQVMLTMAARAGRIMWTYEQMPYAVILKHVGVLTQTLYLTATAMGLGGVAQGYGDTAAFAAATGRDELVECNVGTFVVGRPRG